MSSLLAGFALLGACDERFNPTRAITRPPPVTVATGQFDLVAVDGEPLPHIATSAGTDHALTRGTFALNADSTRLYSSTEAVSGTNGVFIGTSLANYTGTWTVADSTINILEARGTIEVKGDTLFWTGGPKQGWEETLRFTLVRR